jgi:hypothetical protein
MAFCAAALGAFTVLAAAVVCLGEDFVHVPGCVV